MAQIVVTYNPHIYDVSSIDDAMRIILTPEDSTTEHRWATETPYLADLMAGSFNLTEQSLVLDYGCGIGRLSKELIARNGCSVIGVDISPSMRTLATVYVASDRFLACAPPMLDLLVARGTAFDLILTVWVLQHCPDIAADVSRIKRALALQGGVFVVNQRQRAVPTVERGWMDDGVNVDALLRASFDPQCGGPLDPRHTSEGLAYEASWGVYRRQSDSG